MSVRTASIGVIAIILVGAVAFFLGIPAWYSYTENQNFEEIRKKSLLDCETMPLHCLVRQDALDEMASYFSRNGELEDKDNWGQTALLWAIWWSKDDATRLLLNAGANPDAMDDRGYTALLQLLRNRKYDLAALLLQSGGNIDLQSNVTDRQTSLHSCVMENNAECVKFLVDHGADTGIKDDYGYTVQDRARIYGHISPEIAEMLRD